MALSVALAVIILCWYGFNAAAGIVSKLALQRHAADPWAFVELSLCQAIVGVCMGSAFVQMRQKGGKHSNASSRMQDPGYRSNLRQVSASHALGNILTNISISLIGTSSTQILKAAEPICTIALSRMLNGTVPTRSILAAVGIICIGLMVTMIHGVNLTAGGVAVVLLSDFALPFRNIVTKKIVDSGVAVDNASLFTDNVRQSLPFFAALFAVKVIITRSISFDSMLIWSGICTNGYQLASFLCLEHVDAVTHSVANVFKRVFTILAALLYFQEPLTVTAFVGLEIAFAGLLLYGQAKSKSFNWPQWGGGMTLVTVLLLMAHGWTSSAQKSQPRLTEEGMPISSSAPVGATFVARRIFNVHRVDKSNIGDMLSTPLQYFPELKSAVTAVIDVGDNAAAVVKKYSMRKGDLVIIGGGGLLHAHDSWTNNLFRYCKLATCVLWAPGYNLHHGREVQPFPNATSILELAIARTVRDVNPSISVSYQQMLDASCLHPLLDMQCEVVRKIGYYVHTMFRGNLRHEVQDVLHNDESDQEKVFKFLCESDQVVTSSYHGTLWATYLNKSVSITDTFSEKFDMLPFDVSRALDEPAVVDGTSIRDKCRTDNRRFYDSYVRQSVEHIQSKNRRKSSWNWLKFT